MTDLTLRGTPEELTGHPDPDDLRRDDPVVEAVAAELEDRDMGIWFALLAENGAIEAQGWQLQEVLRGRGIEATLREVQDAMLQLAHELLGSEDPRLGMLRRVADWMEERPKAEQARYREIIDEEFPDHWEAPAAEFRRFLRMCCERSMEKGEVAWRTKS